MADTQLFANNAVALLAAPISATDTSLTVMPGYGALFPLPSAPGEYFLVTLENQSATTREIIRVNARAGNTFTSIDRAQEGTLALAWGATSGNDTLVDHRVTAETLRQSMVKPPSNFGVGTNGATIAIGSSSLVNTMLISAGNKTCKWIITICTADNRITMAEVLAVHRAAPLTPAYNVYARVGDAVNFAISVIGSPSDMSLQITNNDTVNFSSVDVIRIQHLLS